MKSNFTLACLFAGLLVLANSAVAGSGTVTYGYDDAGRLTTVNGGNGVKLTYQLDPAGNRVSTAGVIAPTGLTATAGNAQISLSWTAASGATSYNVYEGTSAGGESSTPVATGVTGNSNVIIGLSSSTHYFFKVTEVAGSAESPPSNEASATPFPPAAPSALNATPGFSQATLSWSASTGAASYNVYQGTSTNGESATPVKTSVTGTSIVINSLTNGTAYFFKVTAVNGGESSQSSEASATPQLPAPTGLSGTGGAGQVSLNWTGSIGAASYSIYDGTATGGESATAALSGISGTTATVTGLSGGAQYYFIVKAINGSTTSAASNEFSALTIPAVPAGVSATAGNSQVTLTWFASTGATSYSVYQGTAANGESATPVKTGVTGTTTTITGLSNNTQYYFKVTAVDSGGQSAQSSETSAVTAPSAPTGLTATGGLGQITLNWSAVAGAAKYNVYQSTSAGGEGASPVINGVTSTNVSVAALSDGTQYYFTVKAVNSSGAIGGASNEANAWTIPQVPTGANATGGNGQITLTWFASTGATSYNVYQGSSAGAEGATPVKTGVTGTSTTVTGLSNNTQYFFKLSAVNSTGESNESGEVSAATASGAPTNLTATSGNSQSGSSQIVLSWTAAAGATSYNVYQGTSAGGEGTSAIMGGISGTSATISGGLLPATRYYFIVKAITGGNLSVASNEANAITAPDITTGVVATGSSGQVGLSWSATTGATSYNVYQGTSPGGEGSTPAMTGVTGTSANVIGLSSNTHYYFQIAAVNTGGAGRLSNEVNALTAPAAPTGVTATGGASQVNLSWTASAGATGYNIYQGTSAGGEGTNPVMSNISGTSYSVTGLLSNTQYFFKVVAVGGILQSASSAEVSSTTAPVIPAGLAATGGIGQVALSWSPPPGVSSYNIYQGTSPNGEGSTPAQTGVTGSSTTVTGLGSNATYYFKISALNASGAQSSQSNEANATTAPAAPTGVTAATSGSGTQITISWTASAGATSYNIYRGATAGGEGSSPFMSNVSGTSYTVTGLLNNSQYFFKVSANNGSLQSAQSAEVSATTVPANPNGLNAIGGTNQVTLNWSSTPGASSYNIYQGTTSNGEGATPLMTGVTGTSVTVTGLSSNTTYYYKISAANNGGQSGLSTETSAITH